MSSLDTGTNPLEVSQRIRVIRGQRVLLDSDLAQLYGVTAKRLNGSGVMQSGFRKTLFSALRIRNLRL